MDLLAIYKKISYYIDILCVKSYNKLKFVYYLRRKRHGRKL